MCARDTAREEKYTHTSTRASTEKNVLSLYLSSLHLFLLVFRAQFSLAHRHTTVRQCIYVPRRQFYPCLRRSAHTRRLISPSIIFFPSAPSSSFFDSLRIQRTTWIIARRRAFEIIFRNEGPTEEAGMLPRRQ